jgi:hypothetical protein|tara:strand:+ start:469 stop:693 length:225 start_codon:yes stop_codon:yes gene_type:complete
MGKLMRKPEVLRKIGKFKFLRFPNQGIRRNKRIRELATSGKLSYPTLEKFIERERSLGYPIKYSKPIGFKRKRK